jgi:tRNA A-37 threonylcarbamoyl transferase component Bud32/tetratricopeptide (TPR) repeat protein
MGRRLGPYELGESIGSGGMGEVFRAARADSEYQQQVAIKLVRAGFDTAFISARLRAERQILATLEHPNIARLLDGGTTADGVPYLVMELVDGVPIDHYCEQHRLDVPARLRLFIQVCSAVQYAHRHMVIHRDIKPRNILVTADGVPKLLDFGVAKILDPGAMTGASDVTLNAQRLLTPGYASPEQLQGELITSASDVYSLGIILYELLTDTKPFASTKQDPYELLRAQLESEPAKPSRVTRRHIGTDLDNVVLMALRREPERRYATVEQLAEDIRRYLLRQPIIARRDTFLYRSSVFVARHKFAVAAAVFGAVALLIGITVSVQAARVAQAQRVRAERRFDEVRKLSNALIFDIHDSIRFLPGAADSRRLLAKTAARYLDSLSQESADDPALERELAAAYERLGDIQGQPREANEGDYDGALESYQRALALREASAKLEPHNNDTRRDILVNSGKLSDMRWDRGEAGRALSFSRQAITEGERLVAADGVNEVYRRLLAVSLGDYGYKLFKIRGDVTAALPYMRRSIASLQALAAGDPANWRIARTLSLTESRTAEMLARSDRSVMEALSLDERAQQALLPALAKDPANTDLRHLLVFTDYDRGNVLLQMDHLEEASAAELKALEGFRALAAADPKIAEYRFDVGLALAAQAEIAERRNESRQAVALLREALDNSAVTGTGPANASARFAIAREQALLGKAYAMLAADVQRPAAERNKDWVNARDYYGKALQTFEALMPSWAEATGEARLASDEIERAAIVLNAGLGPRAVQ